MHSHCQLQEFSKKVSADENTLAPSVFELQHCDAFQRYVQLSLAAGICRSIFEFVRVFVDVTGDTPSLAADSVSNDYRFLELTSTLQKLSSKLVSEFLQNLCKTNFDFVCFIARSTVEHFISSRAIGNASAHSILSPVAIALRRILDLDNATCIRFGSTIMKCRAFVSQPGSPFTIVSGEILQRLASATDFHPPQFDVKHFIKIIRALIVAVASDHQPVLMNALLFELLQTVHMHFHAIQSTFSLQQEAVVLIWDVMSASASFIKLPAEQLASTFVSIVEAMKNRFQNNGMDAARCTDIVSSALACTLVVVLLKSKEGGSALSAECAVQLHQKIPEFLKWVSLCLSQFMTSKYLEYVPLAFTHNLLTYVRCSAPMAASPFGTPAEVLETKLYPSATCKAHSRQPAAATVEEMLWLSVSAHQPLMVDCVTLDLLEKRSASELCNDIECPYSLECSIKQSLSRLHAAAKEAAHKNQKDATSQQSAPAGGGAACAAATIVEAQPNSREAAASHVAPFVGATCHKCSEACGVTFYWSQGPSCALSASLKPSYMCLRCVIEEFIPKDSLCNLTVSSVFPVSLTQPIFQMALQRSLSALKHCKIVLLNGFGSPSVIGAAEPTQGLSPQFAPEAMPVVSKFHECNSAITMSNAKMTASKQKSSSYGAAYSIVNALPVANECSFQVVIDSESCNPMSFGVAPRSLPLEESNGAGPTIGSIGSWGILSSSSNSYSYSPTVVSKKIASGSEVGEFRGLRKGDRLKGIVNFERRCFQFFLNDTEVTHTFTLDENLKADNCVFALTLAASSQVTIVDQSVISIRPIIPRDQDPLGYCDVSYVWMQSITQEVARMAPSSLCNEESLAVWFNHAMSTAASLLGDASNGASRVINSFRFTVARNALFVSMSDPSVRAAVAAQLLPSLLRMCEDSVACTTPCSASAPLIHLLTCDVAATSANVDSRSSTAVCIKQFTGGNFARTLKLYVGLHASFNLTWDYLLGVSNHEDNAAVLSCASAYKEHAEFIRGVVCSELSAMLPAVSVAEMMDALGKEHDCSKIAAAVLPQVFTQHADIRWHMANWTARAITGDATPSKGREAYSLILSNFVLKLSCLTFAPPPPKRRFICICGATGQQGNAINGIYDEVDKTSFERAVYMKRNETDRCIHFFNGKKPHWVVAHADDIGKNSKAYAFLEYDGPLDSVPSLDAWSVWNGLNKSWEQQENFRCFLYEVVDTPRNPSSDDLPNTLECSLHQHSLEKIAAVPKGSYTCSLCQGKGSGCAFHCQQCTWAAHPSCAVDVSSKPQKPSAAEPCSSQEHSGGGQLLAGGGVKEQTSSSDSEDGFKSPASAGQCSDSEFVLVDGAQTKETDQDERRRLTLVAAGDGHASTMLFLQDLHAACFFQTHTDDALNVKSLSSAATSITSFLLSCNTNLSDSLLETLRDIRVQAGQHVLSTISEQARACLFESMTEALLAFADEYDELHCCPAQNWATNKALMSSVDSLSPWVPCVRGLSFDHSPVMSSIAKHIGLLRAILP